MILYFVLFTCTSQEYYGEQSRASAGLEDSDSESMQMQRAKVKVCISDDETPTADTTPTGVCSQTQLRCSMPDLVMSVLKDTSGENQRLKTSDLRPISPHRETLRCGLKENLNAQSRMVDYVPRAAKLKKYGSGDQLIRTERDVLAKRSESVSDPRPSEQKRQDDNYSSLASSQSTVDSLESASFVSRACHSPFRQGKYKYSNSISNEVQQLTSALHKSALNSDEGSSSSRVSPATLLIPKVTVNDLPHVMDSRSSYFPTCRQRCSNPVSNALEYGDDTHFIPAESPPCDDVR